MDFDDFDDYEDYNDYDDFEDCFWEDDMDKEIDDPSEKISTNETESSRTGLEWYEMAFLGGLADELSEEKKQRRRLKKDRNHPKRKP
jgi:hypothetical protein